MPELRDIERQRRVLMRRVQTFSNKTALRSMAYAPNGGALLAPIVASISLFRAIVYWDENHPKRPGQSTSLFHPMGYTRHRRPTHYFGTDNVMDWKATNSAHLLYPRATRHRGNWLDSRVLVAYYRWLLIFPNSLFGYTAQSVIPVNTVQSNRLKPLNPERKKYYACTLGVLLSHVI